MADMASVVGVAAAAAAAPLLIVDEASDSV